MNVKYEHLFIFFATIGAIFCIVCTLNYWFDRADMEVRCTENLRFLPVDKDISMWCKWPDGTSGFVKQTYRN